MSGYVLCQDAPTKRKKKKKKSLKDEGSLRSGERLRGGGRGWEGREMFDR